MLGKGGFQRPDPGGRVGSVSPTSPLWQGLGEPVRDGATGDQTAPCEESTVPPRAPRSSVPVTLPQSR